MAPEILKDSEDEEDSCEDDYSDEEEDEDEDDENGCSKSHYDINGNIIRGSRTNSKGHWSKEEVRTFISLLYNLNGRINN